MKNPWNLGSWKTLEVEVELEVYLPDARQYAMPPAFMQASCRIFRVLGYLRLYKIILYKSGMLQ
jgi:hypothetical protein